MSPLKWTDADEIGFRLGEKFPDLDPLSVSFTDLHQRVLQLEEFNDTGESSEGILEAIQMAWLEYYRENR
ncbi:MAG: Fe-S cluster assembly protein IscX [Planctomycetota bacterium]|jgi:FeS assembly protein IscX